LYVLLILRGFEIDKKRPKFDRMEISLFKCDFNDKFPYQIKKSRSSSNDTTALLEQQL